MNGTIKWGNIIWTGTTASITASTEQQQYYIQYQIGGTDGTWITASVPGEIVTISVTLNNIEKSKIVYARLWDQTTGSKPASIEIKDTTPPTVQLRLSSSTINSLTVTASATDNQTGMATTPTYIFFKKAYGAADSTYTQVQTGTNSSCTVPSLSAGTTYVIKVETKDIGEIVGSITLTATTQYTLAQQVNNNSIKVGDYVAYTPTGSSSTTMNATYTGYSSTQTVTREPLNWRILDVSGSQVRLISELPTTNLYYFAGVNGYNNAVYLLNTVCQTLYSSSLGTARSLCREDVEEKMTTASVNSIYTYMNNIASVTTSYSSHPTIFRYQKNAIVNGTSTGGTLDLNQQTTTYTSYSSASNITAKQTYWGREMLEEWFPNSMHYTLFIKKNSSSFYASTQWLATRVQYVSSPWVIWGVGQIENDGYLNAVDMFNNQPYSYAAVARSIRPIVTLNSNVAIDTSVSGRNGSSASTAWVIK